MAIFKKDSLSEFLRPATLPTKGGVTNVVPPSSSHSAPAEPWAEESLGEILGLGRPRAAAGPDELMAHLRAHGPMSPAALLDAVGLALAPGLETLDRLERYGLVLRETRDGAVVVRAAG